MDPQPILVMRQGDPTAQGSQDWWVGQRITILQLPLSILT